MLDVMWNGKDTISSCRLCFFICILFKLRYLTIVLQWYPLIVMVMNIFRRLSYLFYRMVVMVLLFASSGNTTKDFHTTTKLLDLRVMFHYVIPSIELWLKSLSGWCFILFDLRILVFRTPSKLHWGFWWVFLCALHNHFRLWNAMVFDKLAWYLS